MFRSLVITLSLICGASGASAAGPSGERDALLSAKVVAHGGGCRKSSPPGQCCHMETRTGTVHCH